MWTGRIDRDYDLETQLQSHRNQFNLLRLGLASLVLFDHAGLVTAGVAGAEPLKIFRFSVGYLAVNGFFILSGILIARSLAERGVSASYFSSRLLRLFPALIALALLATLVIGPLVSQTPYWSGLQTFSYASEILRFGDTSGGPIGFYPNNPYPQEFNPPLWTLRYEFICYMVAPLCLIAGLHNRPGVTALLVGLVGVVLVIAPASQQNLFGSSFISNCVRLSFCFGLGMLIWSARKHVSGQLTWVLATSALLPICHFAGAGLDLAMSLWVASILLCLGLRLPNKHVLKTDLSYGIYIWHYPIMQIIVGEVGDLHWTGLFIAALPITLAVAWLSWTYIERPALGLKKRFPSSAYSVKRV